MDRGSEPAASGPGVLASGLASRLAVQVATVLSNLPQRVHPAWVASLGFDAAFFSQGGHTVMNTVLQARFDLCWPDLSAADEPLELVGLLPPEQQRRLCAVRALYPFRGVLARSVDGAARRTARGLVGSETFDALLQLPERRREDRALPPLDPDGLASAGWALMGGPLRWADVRLRRLAELSLPPAAALARNAWGQDAGPATLAETEHAGFMAALTPLFPEHQWLFGSELASLRSA
jgi:hypothetical protein